MKLLFIENKHMARTWEAVAPLLEDRGHEVHWLVQNPRFAPSGGRVQVMPFPPAPASLPDEPDLLRIASQDRGIVYFGGDARHYRHYMREIESTLDRLRPDVVFGEPTLFHERLTIEACRKRGIPYYFPCTVRYPSDRFGFYRDDMQKLEHGSGERLSDSIVDALLEVYGKRKSPPLYYARSASRLQSLLRRFEKDWTSIASWFEGERYNTPAPWMKIILERRKAARFKEWSRLAARDAVPATFKILFPLQMLPESNLELYGAPYADQLALLEAMLAATPSDVGFIVKANPVPRYEVTDDWLTFIAREPRVEVLPLEASMDQVFWNADLIVTVTGSVAVEAFLTGRPFVTFAESPVTPFAPGALLAPSQLGTAVEAIRAGAWRTPGPEARRSFLESQIASSHAGVVADVYNYPGVTEPDNIRRLADAFDGLVRSLRKEAA